MIINKKAQTKGLFLAEIFLCGPGNSGGALLSLDGKIVGIVIQSLTREQEIADFKEINLPFFAALPAEIIIEHYHELAISKEFALPIEDYE